MVRPVKYCTYRLHVETRSGARAGDWEEGKGVPLRSADRRAVNLDVGPHLELVAAAQAFGEATIR